jgi:hypothetical protein
MSVNHSKHKLSATPSVNVVALADELFLALRDFKYFDGGCNTMAVVYGKHDLNGVCYAMFDTGKFFGWCSSWINPRVVPVRIWCDKNSRKVVGDTAGDHMLIGQRHWWVEVNSGLIEVLTEAYERPRDWRNRAGMWCAGRRVQLQIWTCYLENILAELLKAKASGGAVAPASAPSKHSGNPWPPKLPYPGCHCRI